MTALHDRFASSLAPVVAIASEPPKPRFVLLSDVELESLPEQVPLVDGVANVNGLIALIGKYGTMKTFVLLDVAMCIALGVSWHGRTVRQGSVLYIYAEGAWGARKRLNAWKAANGYTGSADIFFLPTSVLLDDPAQVVGLLTAIDALDRRFAAIMVDTVARNMQGDEQQAKDMNQFVRGCDRIREATGAAVFLAHHMGWVAERSRGSTTLPGAVDTEIQVERDDLLVTLKCTKQKDGPEFAPITLEAFPIAESLALKAVVPTRAELTRNERLALNVVQAGEGLSSSAWMEATDLAKGSFHNARNRLLALAYVRLRKKNYEITDAGTLALGTTVNAGTSEVQRAESARYNQHHTPIGVSVVPDRPFAEVTAA
jgi:hypothetical protein